MSGCLSALLFWLLPAPSPTVAILTALLTIIGNVAYAASIVCANAFLPGLAREDPTVQAVPGVTHLNEEQEEHAMRDEYQPLLDAVMPAIAPISTADLASTDPALPSHAALPESTGPLARQNEASILLSLATSRISSLGTALGFFSGLAALTLLLIPVSAMGGSIASLRLAIGLCGLWWGLFTIPAGMGLPGSNDRKVSLVQGSVLDGWRNLSRTISPSEMRRLSHLFRFLLAWIFLSDGARRRPELPADPLGFHTTTYTAVLFATSALSMSSSQIMLMTILVQLAAFLSSMCTPYAQRRLGWSNMRLLLTVAVMGEALPIYACIGLVSGVGGLRSVSEMYVAGVWFGLVSGAYQCVELAAEW